MNQERILSFTIEEIHGFEDGLTLYGQGLWREHNLPLRITAAQADRFEPLFQTIHPLRNFIKAMYAFDEDSPTVFDDYSVWYPEMIKEGATYFDASHVVLLVEPSHLEWQSVSESDATFHWDETNKGILIKSHEFKKHYALTFNYIGYETT
jgi:hypothetical protein